MFRRSLPVLVRALTGASSGGPTTSRAVGGAVYRCAFSVDAAADAKAKANGWGQTRVHELLDAKVRGGSRSARTGGRRCRPQFHATWRRSATMAGFVPPAHSRSLRPAPSLFGHALRRECRDVYSLPCTRAAGQGWAASPQREPGGCVRPDTRASRPPTHTAPVPHSPPSLLTQGADRGAWLWCSKDDKVIDAVRKVSGVGVGKKEGRGAKT